MTIVGLLSLSNRFSRGVKRWRGFPRRWASGARVAEAAATVVTVERVADLPLDLFDSLNDELSNSVTASDGVFGIGVGVDQDDLDLSAVGGVNEARAIDNADAMFECHAAPWEDEASVSSRNGYRDAGRDKAASTARGKNCGLGGVQIEASIAFMSVGRYGQICVELNDRDGEGAHGCAA